MEGSKKSQNVNEGRAEICHQNEHNQTTSLLRAKSGKTKVHTNIMPCYETTRSETRMNGDSLESLLDGCLQLGKSTYRPRDSHHRTNNTPINYEMIEDTLLETLNLTRNPKSLKKMSHTILQYFTYVVFNQIKNNYHKKVCTKNECNSGICHDSTVFLFNREYECACAVNNALKKISKEIVDKNLELASRTNTRLRPLDESSNRQPYSKQKLQESSTDSTFSNSSQATIPSEVAEDVIHDSFLCNIPNAPPFILKMKKASPAPKPPELSKLHSKESFPICSSSISITSTDESFDVKDRTAIPSSLVKNNSSFYTEIPNVNMFIDANCPRLEDTAFKKFVRETIMWTKEDKRLRRPRGPFMSAPTICLAGFTNISKYPFGMDEGDPRRPAKNNKQFSIADVLCKRENYPFYSKIPRMLHPGKCKVQSQMKNVPLASGSKKCASIKASIYSGSCPSDKIEIKINPCIKIRGSTAYPSLTNARPSIKVKAVSKPENESKNVNTPALKSSKTNCIKSIKSDQGSYCGNDADDLIPCPNRLRQDCEFVEEQRIADIAESEEVKPLCYCPLEEPALLMKKSNIECDCANKRRCEDDTLAEPPKDKPEVVWALTKLSVLKDGTKNFEIIDITPVPPSYYLMPNMKNRVLVGPQPKPPKATP